MAIRLGDTAPNFKAQTTVGELDFYEWMGKDWAVLFSHPKDYTPVCTTELGAVAKLNFPLVADPDRVVSTKYDMIHPEADNTFTVRSVFVVDDAKKVRLTITYPASTGRNFDEILRVIDSLKSTSKHQVATPVNWTHGQDVIISPAVSNEEAKTKYASGWKEVKPYLRYVPDPTK